MLTCAEAPQLGIGIGWRPEIDLTVERLEVDFVECVAEDIHPRRIPASLRVLRERGLPVLPHAVSLSLAGAEPVDTGRVRHLARVATALDAPLVSDHIAFTRAGGWEAGHILPPPRTSEALEVLIENVRQAQELLPVPLALEHVAALVEWPDAEFSEAEFISQLVARTGCCLILDVANLYANACNLGTDPASFLDTVPLDRLAYVHVGGGTWQNGVYHDTHAHPVVPEVLDLLVQLRARTSPLGVLLERDDRFPGDDELAAELTALRAVIAR
jgi:uncharacterized protein